MSSISALVSSSSASWAARMSANSVLPPFGLTTRADSSENFAGIGRNELSECHRQLPRLNRWTRLAVLAEVGDVVEAGGEPRILRLDDIAAARILALAEIQRERHLLLIGDILAVEHQHGVFVHAGFDIGGLLGRQ